MLATTIHKSNTTPHHQSGATTRHTLPDATPPPVPHTTGRRGDGLAVSKPNSVSGGQPRKANVCLLRAPEPETHYRPGPSNESPSSPNPHTMWAGLSLVVLLRKEVIQPHLPVRLPCYDFVPIADPTFDRSLPYGLGHGLRVLPTFMT